jgi:hypothetical protein
LYKGGAKVGLLIPTSKTIAKNHPESDKALPVSLTIAGSVATTNGNKYFTPCRYKRINLHLEEN